MIDYLYSEESIKKLLRCTFVAALAISLVGCGSNQVVTTTPEESLQESTDDMSEAPTDIPPSEEISADDLPTPTATHTPGPPATTPLEALAAELTPRAGDPDVVAATLYLMLDVPYEDGEAFIFHFEDAMAGVSIGCTGYALAEVEGEGWNLVDLDVFCGAPTGPGTPITVFAAETPSGLAVFGEIYDAAVTSVVVIAGAQEVIPSLGGGAYLERLPDASPDGVRVRALGSDGAMLFEGTPPPPPGGG